MFTLAQEPRLVINEEPLKPTVEVRIHFGTGQYLLNCITETYQFAYFFRKTEPHTVLFKVGKHTYTATSKTQ